MEPSGTCPLSRLTWAQSVAVLDDEENLLAGRTLQ